MDSNTYIKNVGDALLDAVETSRANIGGKVADYIPELAKQNPDFVNGCILLSDGESLVAGDDPDFTFTIQSVSKVVLLIGLLEEFGTKKVFSWINTEPSGQHFASISQLERSGPIPANPFVNAGAIALADKIPGHDEQSKINWIDSWMARVFGEKITHDQNVFKSEILTADRNRALAYLLKSNGVLENPIEEILDLYTLMCSYQVNIKQAAYLPTLLANGGLTPNNIRIFSEMTSSQVVSIMATCGLYDESGTYLVNTGMPAKSGVSGLIIAVATGRGGVAAFSPCLNPKGGSVRGHHILAFVSKRLDWHFAVPWGYARLDSKLHCDI